MEFLRLLEGLRTPAVSAFMAAITYLGDETVLDAHVGHSIQFIVNDMYLFVQHNLSFTKMGLTD